MTNLRPAAVAGAFYPADAALLRSTVDRLLASVPASRADDTPTLKALIVPHAGYVYSGPVAAQSYARLRSFAAAIRRVVLLGPAHRVPLQGLALPGARGFATPLGDIEIDRELTALALSLPEVRESVLAHAGEHSLEVQLPFLQRVLGEFTLLPLVVGDARAESIAQVLEALWGGPETLIVVSSDLSHYHPYEMAQRIDRETADAIVALDPTLDHQQACGATPVNGLLLAARRRRLRPALFDLRNSGDTAGDRRRVVGYAAFGFEEEAHAGH